MEIWTIPEGLTGKYRPHINFGDRGFWCEFDYAVAHVSHLEGIEVVHTKTDDEETREWFPSIKRGVERAFQSLLEQGRMITAVRVEISKVYTHPVDTTASGCESYGFRFLHDIVQFHGKKV